MDEGSLMARLRDLLPEIFQRVQQDVGSALLCRALCYFPLWRAEKAAPQPLTATD